MINKSTQEERRLQIEVEDSLKLEFFGIANSSCGSRIPPHSHIHWELIYITKGSCMVRFESGIYNFKEGALFLIKPGNKHQFENIGPISTEKMYIDFSINLFPYKQNETGNEKLENLFDDGGQINESTISEFYEVSVPIHDAEKNSEFILIDNSINANEIRAGLKLIMEALKEYDNRVPLTIRIRIIDVLLKILNYFGQGDSNINSGISRKEIICNKVKSYLAKNTEKSICIEELAGNFYLSPHYLSDIFKEITGMSLKAYHNMLRMKFSLHMLNTTSMSISEVAFKAGFQSIHYFSRRFKEYYGISPSDIRRANAL